MPRKTPSSPSARESVRVLAVRPTADVLIIGGGINGIATFRDLAAQGVDVAIVERADFVSGASSASSHMIHGGVRYLENGEFRLVRESVRERNALLQTAPHYVRPLKTTIPIYSTFSGLMSAPLRFLTGRKGKPSERGALLIKVGLTFYDIFSRGGRVVPRHQFAGRTRSLEQLPDLNPRIKYTATYFDAAMHDPERLALDVLADGLAEGAHARAANYVEARGSANGDVELIDHTTGHTFAFQASVVINATGPWADQTNGAIAKPTEFTGGTKGSHIVLHNDELLRATDGREIFFEHGDGRIVLIYPLEGRVLVGTTDLPHDMSEPIRCTDAEVDYFFDLIAHVFPGIPVDRTQIVYKFAGVRPLPRADAAAPGAVSRDYEVHDGYLPDGRTHLLSLIGGKWTTFRALGEHLSDRALALLDRTRVRSTEGAPIGGGRNYPTSPDARAAWLSLHGGEVGRGRAETLLERYGSRAEQVIDYLVDAPDSPLAEAPTFSQREVEWIVRSGRVVHLDDLILRRTNLAFTGQVTTGLLTDLATIVGPVLGWTDDERAAEVARTRALLATEHGTVIDETSIEDDSHAGASTNDETVPSV